MLSTTGCFKSNYTVIYFFCITKTRNTGKKLLVAQVTLLPTENIATKNMWLPTFFQPVRYIIVLSRSKIVFHRAQNSAPEKYFLMWLRADIQADLEILFMVQLKGFFEMLYLAQDGAYLRSHFQWLWR